MSDGDRGQRVRPKKKKRRSAPKEPEAAAAPVAQPPAEGFVQNLVRRLLGFGSPAPGEEGKDPETAETIPQWMSGKRLPSSAHLFLGLVVPAGVALVNMWRLKHHTVDDAYISYRYARNLARG